KESLTGQARADLLSPPPITQENFANRYCGSGWLDLGRFSDRVQDAGPGIKHWHAGFNELAGVTRDDNQIVERRNGGNEQIRLSESVTAPLPIYDHCFPAKNDVLGDRQDSPSKQRAQSAVEPQMNVGSAASVRQLLDAKPDLGESDLCGEERVAGL